MWRRDVVKAIGDKPRNLLFNFPRRRSCFIIFITSTLVGLQVHAVHVGRRQESELLATTHDCIQVLVMILWAYKARYQLVVPSLQGGRLAKLEKSITLWKEVAALWSPIHKFTASGLCPNASVAHGMCSSTSSTSWGNSTVSEEFWCCTYGTPTTTSTTINASALEYAAYTLLKPQAVLLTKCCVLPGRSQKFEEFVQVHLALLW